MLLECLLIGFITSGLSLLLLHRYASRLNLLDVPTNRKRHVGSVPLVGGISIFLGVWIGVLSCPLSIDSLLPFFVASLFITFTGMQDDRFDISIKSRLVVEVVSIAIIIYFSDIVIVSLGDLFGMGQLTLDWIAYPFTVISIIGVINALNMVDGIDGLAGSLALIALVTMGLIAMFGGNLIITSVAFLFSVSILPYLFCNIKLFGYNFRVFLGDSGSMLLGFAVACLAISLTQPISNAIPLMSPVTALWLFAIPIVDTVAIMIRRAIKGQSPFMPDRDHIHHVVIRMGYRDSHAFIFITSIALILTIFGVWLDFSGVSESVSFSLFLVFSFLYIIIMQFIWRFIVMIKWIKLKIYSVLYD